MDDEHPDVEEVRIRLLSTVHVDWRAWSEDRPRPNGVDTYRERCVEHRAEAKTRISTQGIELLPKTLEGEWEGPLTQCSLQFDLLLYAYDQATYQVTQLGE